MSDSATPWTAVCQTSLSFTISWSLLKLMSMESVMPSSHLILCFPAFNISQHQGLLKRSTLCIRWSKYWNFNFSTSPSNDYSRLISFRIDWFDVLTVQGTLKSLLQHHSLKSSILPCSAYFMAQHPYMVTGKTIALTRQTFVGTVMPLLFNILFRFVIVFLPRSRHRLILWLQPPFPVILEPK